MTLLSPWPSDSAELATAISTLKDAVNPGATNESIKRLGAVASARVEQYAPTAPDVIRTEAVIRFAGYLSESAGDGFGAVRSKSIDIDSVTLQTDSTTNHAAAFRNCGAAALLSPWKVRRAGAIGGTNSAMMEQTIMPSEQLASIPLTETPVNIADGLSPGEYQFQVSVESDGLAVVLYAYGDMAPSELSHYFTAEYADLVGFTVVTGTRLWARVRSNNQPATVAIARL